MPRYRLCSTVPTHTKKLINRRFLNRCLSCAHHRQHPQTQFLSIQILWTRTSLSVYLHDHRTAFVTQSMFLLQIRIAFNWLWWWRNHIKFLEMEHLFSILYFILNQGKSTLLFSIITATVSIMMKIFSVQFYG